MNTSIGTTNLSVRAKNALHGAGIHTVEQLKVTPFEQLRRIRNMGKKSLADIEDFLEAEGGQPLLASQATLRDYFAGNALQGFLACHAGDSMLKLPDDEHVARYAYRVADAMLKAREQ